MNAEAMERFEMRLGQVTLQRVDDWRSRQADVPSRSEAVRRLMEVGLDATGESRHVRLSDGDRLVLIMLCELFKHMKVKGGEIDPGFVEAAVFGGHHWGLEWKYSGLFHGHEDAKTVVSEVVNILDMWYFLERGFAELPKQDKDRVAAEAEPFGKNVLFRGFDGNNETEHVGVARFLINELDRFTEFKGRDLNAHMPTLEAYRRMLAVFDPIRATLIGRNLDASEIIKILNARVHPIRRRV
jgi:uncharacterized protein YfbU (UPF0304 family)